jgi:hypothetical protein
VVASGQLDSRVKIYIVRKRLAASVNKLVLVPGLFVEWCLVLKPKENLALEISCEKHTWFVFSIRENFIFRAL